MTPTVSAIVCTRDRPEELERCLEALRALSPAAEEIVVVNNARSDEPARTMALAAGARYVHEPRQGASRARNAGVAAATMDILAFVDDDAIPDPGWAGALRVALEDPTLGAATGRVLGLTTTINGEADLGERAWRLDRSMPQWFERANFGGLGIGCNMAFRREVFDAGERFCEWLGVGTPVPGSEEHYLYFLILRNGFAIAHVPDAVVRHDDATDERGRQKRDRRILRASLGYVVALLVQEPGFRMATLRYVVQGVRGSRRAWRSPAAGSTRTFSRTSLAAAALAAPWRYLGSRLLHRYRSAP